MWSIYTVEYYPDIKISTGGTATVQEKQRTRALSTLPTALMLRSAGPKKQACPGHGLWPAQGLLPGVAAPGVTSKGTWDRQWVPDRRRKNARSLTVPVSLPSVPLVFLSQETVHTNNMFLGVAGRAGC